MSFDGIGSRILAFRAGTWLSDPNLGAQNPHAPLNSNSAIAHLRNQPFERPWKSVFCTWEAALTRRASFIRNGSTEVYILAVDLEHNICEKQQSLRGVVDAYSVAIANNLTQLQWYGYTMGRRTGFPKEYLIPYGIPDDSVVAWIPALGKAVKISIHLGELQVPEALIAEAEGAREDPIQDWVREEVLLRTGVWNAVTTQRLMRAMCVEVCTILG